MVLLILKVCVFWRFKRTWTSTLMPNGILINEQVIEPRSPAQMKKNISNSLPKKNVDSYEDPIVSIDQLFHFNPEYMTTRINFEEAIDQNSGVNPALNTNHDADELKSAEASISNDINTRL